MNKDVWTRLFKKPQGFRFFPQVVFFAARNGDFPAASRAQLLHEERPKEAAAPADDYAPTSPKTHLAPLVLRSLTADGLHHARHRIVPPVPVADFLFQNRLAVSARREAGRFDVRIHHDGYKVSEFDFRLPAKLRARLADISDEHIYLQGPQVSIGHLDVLLPFQAGIGKDRES